LSGLLLIAWLVGGCDGSTAAIQNAAGSNGNYNQLPDNVVHVEFSLSGHARQRRFELDKDLVCRILSRVLEQDRRAEVDRLGYIPGKIFLYRRPPSVQRYYTVFSKPRWLIAEIQDEYVYLEVSPEDHAELLNHIEERVRAHLPDLRPWPKPDYASQPSTR
jgi:hypothetical protein